MSAMIIGALAGSGKSSFFKAATLKGYRVLDLDSVLYSHFIDYQGNKIDNPFFLENYKNAIERNIDIYDFILIGTHKELRDMLRENNIQYILIYPKISLMNEYLLRYIHRGDSNRFISSIMDNWDDYIVQMMSDSYPQKIVLGPGQFIVDVIQLDKKGENNNGTIYNNV